MVDAHEEVADRLLSQGEHYVRMMNPTGYSESSGAFIASRYRVTLQDVINSLRLEGSASADKGIGGETQKIMHITVEAAREGEPACSFL